jgi:NAD(P) transhydrogenase subunit alpha
MRKLAIVVLTCMTIATLIILFTRPSVSASSPGAEGTGPAAAESSGSLLFFDSLYIFILAGFVGFEVIGRVSPTLHTPLMSATNAISAISIVGAILAAGSDYELTSRILGFVAVAAASTNVIGGFMITDRMLRMFKRKER